MTQILLFAKFQEAVGQESVSWSETPISVSDLKGKLQQQYTQLPDLKHVMVAVNEEYARDETEIKDGDVVAIIPPVSGG